MRLSELGLDSMHAVELSHRIAVATGLAVGEDLLLSDHTVGHLLEHLGPRAARGERVSSRAPPAEQAETITSRLSANQETLWLPHQIDPESPADNLAYAFRAKNERFDVPALEAALQMLVERHESLRTTYSSGPEGSRQHVHTWTKLDFDLIDVADASDSAIREMVATLSREPFDLSLGPVVRARCLRRSDEDVLWVGLHHIAVDLWSLRVLLDDLETFYLAARRARRPTLAPVTPYRELVRQQERLLDSSEGDASFEYWKATTTDALASRLRLPTDRPRPKIRSTRGRSQLHDFPASLRGQLLDLARQERVTLATVCLSAFQVLLARYSGQEDIAHGYTMAARPSASFTDTVGFFVNVVPRTVHLAGLGSFRELLRKNHETSLQHLRHQHFPLQETIRRLGIRGGGGRAPVFDTVFAFESPPPNRHELLGRVGIGADARLSLAGMDLEMMPFEAGGAQFDLSVFLVSDSRGLVGRFEYATDLYDETTIRRLVGRFTALLEDAARHPDAPLDELSVAMPNDTGIVRVVEPASPPAPARASATVVSELERAVDASPDRVALEMREARVTYRELDESANRVARRLAREGVGLGDIVAISMRRSPDLLAAMLGVMKAGAAYLPLDPTFPAERLAYMVAHSGARIVLVSNDADASFADQAVRLSPASWASESRERPGVAIEGNAAAYVMYTSGSTGRPKGVVVPHQGLVNFSAAFRHLVPIRDDDVVLALTTVSFDISYLELFVSLHAGGRVVLGSDEDRRDPEAISQLIEAFGVTVVQATPSTWRMLIDWGFAPGHAVRALCGGEALPQDLADALLERVSSLQNLYGPTEASVWTSAKVLRPGDRVVLAKPITGVTHHVLDRAMRPVPVGLPGELYIGGVCLAHGYHDAPRITAERFLPAPSAHGGERLYRTGDVVRELDNGDMQFLGRVDHQVKIRGHRIELGEIESTLRASDSVADAVVVAREPKPDAPSALVAYVVPAEDARTTAGHAWGSVFDEAYASEPDAAFGIWKSSYTREAIPEPEMQAWLDEAVHRILRLEPRRVLEVGCGTGLVLNRVAPHVERYVGTDVSTRAIEALRESVDERGMGHVDLHVGAALDLSAAAADGPYDLIVMNSVVQYFTSRVYLERALSAASELLAPEGAIFVGDVRSLPLAYEFALDIERTRAGAARQATDVLTRAEHRVRAERELLVAPEFFDAFVGTSPKLRRLIMQPKGFPYTNELSLFRFDVTMFAGGPPSPHPVTATETGPDGDELAELVVGGARLVRGLVHPRLRDLLAQRHALEEAAARAQPLPDPPRPPSHGTTPGEALRTLQDLGLPAELLLGSTSTTYEVYAGGVRDAARLPAPIAEGAALTNHPEIGAIQQALVPALRKRIQAALPPYMMPSAFVVLDALPLTPNGKVDRQRLPSPVELLGEREHVEPRNERERILVDVVGSLLGRRRVSVTDDFFDLGGDSIVAIRLANHANERGLSLRPRDVFSSPVIEDLARLSAEALDSIYEEGERVELSAAQAWFLSRAASRETRHARQISLRFRSGASVDVIRAALERVLGRHDALRVRLSGMAATYGTAASSYSIEHERVDGALARDDPRVAAANREAAAGLDVENGPVVRAVILSATNGPLVLVAAHRAIVDGISLRIVVEELDEAYESLARGQQAPRPERSVRWRTWVGLLHEWIHRDELGAGALHWLEAAQLSKAFALPASERADDSESSVVVSLDVEDTTALLLSAPRAFRNRVDELGDRGDRAGVVGSA